MKHAIVTITFTGSREKQFLDDIRKLLENNYKIIERFELYERGWFGTGKNKVVLVLEQQIC